MTELISRKFISKSGNRKSTNDQQNLIEYLETFTELTIYTYIYIYTKKNFYSCFYIISLSIFDQFLSTSCLSRHVFTPTMPLACLLYYDNGTFDRLTELGYAKMRMNEVFQRYCIQQIQGACAYSPSLLVTYSFFQV